MNNRILIIGAYGGAGQSITRALLKYTTLQITLSGRNLAKLKSFGAKLKLAFPHKVIQEIKLDALNKEGLILAMKNIDLAIVTINNPDFIEIIAEAALISNTDLLDIFVGTDVVRKLDKFEAEIERKGRIFITQAGFHPGLPAPFVRYAAQKMDKLETANIATAMHTIFETPEAAREIFDELDDPHESILKDGHWEKAKYKDMMKFHFSHGFGSKLCYPLPMSELYPLKEELGIRNMALYVAGFNFYVDNFIFPLAMILKKIKKSWGTQVGSRMMYKSLKRNYTGKPKIEFRLEAHGIKDRKKANFKLLAFHKDAYDFTALAVVACIRQYIDGLISKPGLYLMGLAVEPKRIIRDLEEMGIEITEETN